MKYIFDLRTIPEEKLNVSGGKAASLSLMMKNLKMNIPMGYVITAEGFRDGKLTDEASEELNGIIAKLDRLKTNNSRYRNSHQLLFRRHPAGVQSYKNRNDKWAHPPDYDIR